jgi:hypothetical protein
MISNSVGFFGEVDYQIESQKPENGDSESGDAYNFIFGFNIFLYK